MIKLLPFIFLFLANIGLAQWAVPSLDLNQEAHNPALINLRTQNNIALIYGSFSGKEDFETVINFDREDKGTYYQLLSYYQTPIAGLEFKYQTTDYRRQKASLNQKFKETKYKFAYSNKISSELLWGVLYKKESFSSIETGIKNFEQTVGTSLLYNYSNILTTSILINRVENEQTNAVSNKWIDRTLSAGLLTNLDNFLKVNTELAWYHSQRSNQSLADIYTANYHPEKDSYIFNITGETMSIFFSGGYTKYKILPATDRYVETTGSHQIIGAGINKLMNINLGIFRTKIEESNINSKKDYTIYELRMGYAF